MPYTTLNFSASARSIARIDIGDRRLGGTDMRLWTKLVISLGFTATLLLLWASPASPQGVCDPAPTASDDCTETPLYTYTGTVNDTPTRVTTYASGWVEIRLGDTLLAGYRDESGRVPVAENLSYQLRETEDGLRIQRWRNGAPTPFAGQLQRR
ncbi:hypothetical protein [Baaleninema sp.]|uniref:hypothetical protein n=1 Tax=Baaleninema sp. TaxID=3101197 RepID=UPI003D003B95